MAKKNTKANFTPSSSQIVWGVLYLVFQYCALGEVLNVVYGLLGVSPSAPWRNYIYFSLNFLVCLIIFGKYLGNHLSSLGKNWWSCLKAMILGYVFYWVTNWGVSWCLARLIPGFANINDGSIQALLRENFWVMAVGLVVLVPITEETFYRGLIFGGLYNRSKTAAYVVSCLVFSAIHVLGYIGAASLWVLLGCFVQYLPAGLCLSWSFQESGSLFVPIAIHTVVNVLAILSLR
ncbi:MAG: lysostaphin resistance A-like protein [Faecousia sp.]